MNEDLQTILNNFYNDNKIDDKIKKQISDGVTNGVVNKNNLLKSLEKVGYKGQSNNIKEDTSSKYSPENISNNINDGIKYEIKKDNNPLNTQVKVVTNSKYDPSNIAKQFQDTTTDSQGYVDKYVGKGFMEEAGLRGKEAVKNVGKTIEYHADNLVNTIQRQMKAISEKNKSGDILGALKEAGKGAIAGGTTVVGGALDTLGTGIFEGVKQGTGLYTPDFVKKIGVDLGGVIKDNTWDRLPENAKNNIITGAISGNETWKKFSKNNPNLAETIKGTLNIAFNKGLVSGTKELASKETGKVLENTISGVKTIDNYQEALKTAGKIGRDTGKTVLEGQKSVIKGIDAAKLTDSQIKNIKTYDDFSKTISGIEKDIVNKQDNLLKQSTKTFGPSNSKVTTQTALGNVTTNPINESIKTITDIMKTSDQLKAELLNEKFIGKQTTVGDFFNKYKNGNASLEDINDFARYYNSTFKNKIYDAKGNAKDAIISQKYESNRTGLKDFVRNNLDTTDMKNLDKQYSEVAKLKNIIDNANNKVNELEQTLKEKGIGAKLVQGTLEAFDKWSKGTLTGFRNFIITSNEGNKVNNWVDTQNLLNKNLKSLNDFVKRRNITEADVNNLVNTLNNATNQIKAKTIKDVMKSTGKVGAGLYYQSQQNKGKSTGSDSF